MPPKVLTMEEFDFTYARIEDLREAGKLEQEVNLAIVSCVLMPPAVTTGQEADALYGKPHIASASCVLEPGFVDPGYDLPSADKSIFLQAVSRLFNRAVDYIGRIHLK